MKPAHTWDAELDPILAPFEQEYGRIHGKLRKKLLAIQARETAKERASGFELLALKAFASSPIQRLFIQLRDNERA
jgi:hypothetical protein